MRIAQVAPLQESVPPRTYGGTERVVHYVTEALVEQGHEVTLFASGDSHTSAGLHAVVPEALRLSHRVRDPVASHVLQLAQVARRAREFDIIHFHTDYMHFPLWRRMSTPQVTTLHGRLDLPDLPGLFGEFHEMPVISISNDQRGPLPMARWLGTVYNGIPAGLYDFSPRGGDYLAFVGRLSPEKGPEDAIEIAVRAGVPLKIAAKVDAVDRDYYETRIRPRLDHPLIEYVGEIDERGKNALLGGARALLFPIAWREPFGLAMIEALACGTPVIAYRRGSVPEVMAEDVSGAIVGSLDQAVAAVERIGTVERTGCRAYFERRFTAARMAEDYVRLYRQAALRRAPGVITDRVVPDLGVLAPRLGQAPAAPDGDLDVGRCATGQV